MVSGTIIKLAEPPIYRVRQIIEGWYGTTGDITSNILSDRYVRRSHCGINSHPLFTKINLIFQRTINPFGRVR